MDGKHLYFLQLVCYDEERQTSLLPTAGLLRRRTANIFTSYSWSVTTKNGKHLYFLQLVYYDEERQTYLLPTAGLLRRRKANIFTSYSWSSCYDEERQTSLLPTAGLLRRRTANIFTSYSWSATTKNGKHLYFLQMVCYDEERQASLLPTAGLLRLQSGGRGALAASNLDGWQLPTGSCHDKPGPWKRRLGWSDGTCFMDGSFPDSFLH